jgi:hypothetical protein
VQDVQRTLDAEWEKRAEERTNAKHAKKPALPGRNG